MILVSASDCLQHKFGANCLNGGNLNVGTVEVQLALRTETVHGTLRFLFLSHLLYGICVKIFIMNRYISKSYTTTKNTIDRQSRGEGYSHALPIRVCAAQRGRDFEAPDLERGIHFRGVF